MDDGVCDTYQEVEWSQLMQHPCANSPTPLVDRMSTALQYFKAAIKARDETQGEGKAAPQAAAPAAPAK